MRDALAVTAPQPVASFGDGVLFLFADDLVFQRRVAQGSGSRIDNRLQKLHQAGELRFWQAVNQLVGESAGVVDHTPDQDTIRGELNRAVKQRLALMYHRERAQAGLTNRREVKCVSVNRNASRTAKNPCTSKP